MQISIHLEIYIGMETWYVAYYEGGGKTVPMTADCAFRVLDVLGDPDFIKAEQHTGFRLGQKRLSFAHHRIK